MIQEHLSQSFPFDPAEEIRRLRDIRFGRELNPAQSAQLQTYENNHARYAGHVIDYASELVPETNAQMEELNTGEATSFRFNKDGVQSPLDLQAVGLPRLDEKHVPLAVISNRDFIKVVAASKDPKDRPLTSFYLQNDEAITNPDASTSPEWKQPGAALFAGEQHGFTEVSDLNKETGNGVFTITNTSETPFQMIRTVPSKDEAAMMKQELAATDNSRERKYGLRKFIGGVLQAASATGLIVPELFGSADKPITTAAEMVQSTNTSEVNGVQQASQNVDPGVLSRARRAFDAWFKGNKAALNAMTEQSNYKPNWMHEDSLKKVDEASSLTELEQNFNAAMNGMPITLEVADTPDKAQFAPAYETQTPTSDLEGSKKVAKQALGVLNAMDPKLIEKAIGKLRFAVVDHIAEKTDRLGPLGFLGETEGYYWSDQEDGPNQIPTIVLQASLPSDEIVSHELTHRMDDVVGLNQYVNELNPAEHTYAGLKTFIFSNRYIHGHEIADSSYQNADAQEDTAVSGQGIFKALPQLDPNTSVFNEKKLAILYRMEEIQPGFTAAYLSRAEAYTPDSPVLSNVQNALYNQASLFNGSAIAIMAGLSAAVLGGKVRRRREAKRAAL